MPEQSVISRCTRLTLARAALNALGGAILGALVLGGSAIQSTVNAKVVNPGEALEINFAFSAVPVIPGGGVDALVLTAGGISSTALGVPVTAQLFDGGTLLGSGDVPLSVLTAFTAPMSLFAGIPANLDSVVDGSIVGQIRITPDFPGGIGSIEFGSATLIVEAVRGTTAGVVRAQQFAVIASTEVASAAPVSAVPQPASLVLLLSALAALGFFVWRQSEFRSTSRYGATHPSSVT